MQEHQYEALKIKAAVCPEAEGWPRPDHSKTTLRGPDGKPHVDPVDLHWDAIHDAVTEARDRTLKALGSMAGIDADKSLSDAGKADQKRAIAERALAAFEKSPHLSKARSAVERKLAEWNKQLTPSPGDAAINAEIRAHLAKMEPAERVAFIDAHAVECGAAVLSAPAWLSGLTPAELGVVKQRIEARINPEIAEAKAETMKALQRCEVGFRNAANQIRNAANLPKGGNWKAA